MRRQDDHEPTARTALAITAAEAMWHAADVLRAGADRLDRLAGRVSGAGHHLLDWWAARCERRYP